jgi:hypothetical protein
MGNQTKSLQYDVMHSNVTLTLKNVTYFLESFFSNIE